METILLQDIEEEDDEIEDEEDWSLTSQVRDLMATPGKTSMTFSDSLDSGGEEQGEPPSRRANPTEPRPMQAPRLGTGGQSEGFGFNNQADLDQSTATREPGVDRAYAPAAKRFSLPGIRDTSCNPLGSSCKTSDCHEGC